MPKASICTIGDEILIGQIVDTNSSHIASALEESGVRVSRMLSIPDDKEQIISILSNELKLNDIVICTGGLGPTKDDITKDALCTLSGDSEYVKNEEQEAIVREFLQARGLDVLDINLRQALVPSTCKVILNHAGTAPIMVFPFKKERFGHKARLYSLPGVPHEALAALPEVLSDIKKSFKLDKIFHKTIMVYGYAESALSKLIEPWEDALPDDMHLAYLPNTLTGVRLRLSCYGGGEDQQKRVEAQIKALEPLLGSHLYSERDDCLEAVVGRILKENGKTLAVAESATGGEIAHLLTTIPGSSAYFLGSVTSYSPEVKKSVLGVKAKTIEEKGIVSNEVASQMAEGVRRLLGSDFALATTGWADAYGDDKEPAGTVWVGVSGPDGTITQRFNYHNDRKRNIERFAASALDVLRLYMLKYLNN